MRISILTSARSGSTSLYHLIEQSLNLTKYTCISEPFNAHWRTPSRLKIYETDFFEDKKDVFIKTFVSKLQRPEKYLNDEEGYWDWFFNYFDKVIILDRKNKDLQSESLTYHMKKDLHDWHKREFYDMSNITKEEIEKSKKILIDDSEKMHLFAKKGYPLFYFEDLFIDKDKSKMIDIFDYIGVDLIDKKYERFVLSDVNRVRLNEGETPYKHLI